MLHCYSVEEEVMVIWNSGSDGAGCVVVFTLVSIWNSARIVLL